MKGFEAGFVFVFLFWLWAEYLPIQKTLGHRGEDSIVGSNLISPCSITSVHVVFSNGLCRQFVESNLLSCQQPELLGNFNLTPLINNSIGYNLVCVLKALFGDNKWPGRSLSTSLLQDFIKIVLQILGSFHCVILSCKCPSILDTSLHISSLEPISSPLPLLILSSHTNPCAPVHP